MNPNRWALLWIVVSFLLMIILFKVIQVDRYYGQLIGMTALCALEALLIWRIARWADLENERRKPKR